jgi:hypothetical protein
MPMSVVLQLVIVYIVLCLVVGFLGRRRRIGFWGFVFLSVMLTPLTTGLFIFFAAPAPRPRRVATRRA